MNLSTQHGRDARLHGQFLQNTQPDDEDPQWRSVEVTGAGGVPSFADGHQYVAARHATWVYDEDENLIENDHWLFTWDAENRLTSMVTRPAAVVACVPEQKLEFADDAVGRRLQKKVSLKSWGVWNVQDDVRFVYDGWNSTGWSMGRKLPATITLGDVCSRLSGMIGKIPSALKESNVTGGVNDLSSCRPCPDKTKETRHDGSAPSRRRP